jgi:hypothetical protein
MTYAGFLLLALAASLPPDPARQIADAGRCVDLGEKPDARVAVRPDVNVMIAPGPPPVLSFRFYEGKLHHRFGNAELLLDDAGH